MREAEKLVGTLAPAAPVDRQAEAIAASRLDSLTKPPGSLGVLESVVTRLAGIQRTPRPTISKRRLVVFAGDHGVAMEGVSAYPSEVTGQMVKNFVDGGAAINALAKGADAELEIIDVGVAFPIVRSSRVGPPRFEFCPVRGGTRNFVNESAMTDDELHRALRCGVSRAQQAHVDGVQLVGFGEIGIGNTTSAAALAASLSGASAEAACGPGTGLDAEGLARKRTIVSKALERHRDVHGKPLASLRCLGGLEIAAMVGFCLQGASVGLAMVVDGFIASAALSVASRLAPEVESYAFLSHRSAEPGHGVLLKQWKQTPLLNLGLRLGEATGAALAMPILVSAVRAYDEMATFASAAVSDRDVDA